MGHFVRSNRNKKGKWPEIFAKTVSTKRIHTQLTINCLIRNASRNFSSSGTGSEHWRNEKLIPHRPIKPNAQMLGTLCPVSEYFRA
jgi:hypothetical protein